MDENNLTNQPETAENGLVPSGAKAPSAPSQEDGEDLRSLVKELKEAIAKAAPQPEPEPTEEEKKAAELAEKKARRQKARKRRGRAFRALLLRIVLLALVVYVLFFQIIGVTTMPNGDMYPRIDSGDLVLYYRLDKDVRAQDIIVFQMDLGEIQDRVDVAQATPEPVTTPSPTAAILATAQATFAPGGAQPGQPGPSGAATRPAATQAPTEPAATPAAPLAQPTRVPDIPPSQIVDDGTFMGKVSKWIYSAETWLGLRKPTGKQTYVCRVVACEGDTVEITDDGRLVVNGNTMIESNIFSQTTAYVGFTEYPLTLKSGECFVLADLRNGGADSRFFGPVSVDQILGTVITIARRNNL